MERESNLEEQILGITDAQTVEDLDKLLGPLSAEEQTILDDPRLNDPPTQEELHLLGPDFGERVTKKLMEQDK